MVSDDTAVSGRLTPCGGRDMALLISALTRGMSAPVRRGIKRLMGLSLTRLQPDWKIQIGAQGYELEALTDAEGTLPRVGHILVESAISQRLPESRMP